MDQIEQIKKYKELLDEGIITQEEFEAQKKAILDTPVAPVQTADYYSNQYGDPGAYQQANYANTGSTGLSPKATAIMSYFGLIFWLIAYLAGDKVGAKFHLNQSLVITLFSLLSAIPFIGWLWAIFMVVVWVMGLVYAIQFVEKPIPLLGNIQLLK